MTVMSRGLLVIRQQDWRCHFDRQSVATDYKPKWSGNDASSSRGLKIDVSKNQGIFSRQSVIYVNTNCPHLTYRQFFVLKKVPVLSNSRYRNCFCFSPKFFDLSHYLLFMHYW